MGSSIVVHIVLTVVREQFLRKNLFIVRQETEMCSCCCVVLLNTSVVAVLFDCFTPEVKVHGSPMGISRDASSSRVSRKSKSTFHVGYIRKFNKYFVSWQMEKKKELILTIECS